ncbi:MAG: hypothetical protein EOO34_00560 [Cyanobacteriota bacterium]|nr:MAG: hypothetical protein EOO34_00560 [Cyanobacteriota bacterium]
MSGFFISLLGFVRVCQVLGVGTRKGEVSDLKMLVGRSGFVKERFAKKPERELALTNLSSLSVSQHLWDLK